MKTPILQFGTSRFLQAHVDLFVSEALQDRAAIGPITIVQTSGDVGRAGRIAALAAPEGFPVRIRGIESGEQIDRELRVQSVRRALSTVSDWTEIERVFVEEAEIIVSNTGDRGYQVGEGERLGGVPASFPMKLLSLLLSRYRAGGHPLTVLPCELVSRNGAVLKSIIVALAGEHVFDRGFQDWLDSGVRWGNTLVDRIVSDALEPAGAVAEPYALWAIEQQPGLVIPCRHPAVLMVPDLAPYEKLKLHILNLGHTVLADRWLKDRRRPDETVREMLVDPDVAEDLARIYGGEVIPGFASHGLESAARHFVATTLDRFRNPYLDHRLSDIAGNHPEKIERRIIGFIDWCPGIAMPELMRAAGR
ncbi:D-mannonate oxidoreductase [Rhizobium sp. AAP43]|uniref:mannitol dehydrogenase family protein n=1 Tax=Rhizobium sp. AAP43 TaxID=1523420 RepID=UPI0006B89FDE|nr:D-mannonate oxidoreductase [Rhizobium sp. AAP43]KPF45064.1 D-mannonate oxidoreductase [Rhizobium sp. AAP43]